MNVFILNTGRCGSTTIIEACRHITNFSSAHESRCGLLGSERLNYPQNHIEADNRLSWFLGSLDKHYGDSAFYVHLTREQEATAKSYSKRMFKKGIIPAYKLGILMGRAKDASNLEIALDYCVTVNNNIELFLKDKTRKMTMNLESISQDFVEFWNRIGAQGNLEQALAEFHIKHNSSS